MKTNVTYHPDHLGSSSFVTNKFGEATQELRYTPNGEILLNMYDNYNTPYKFSAKEKDQETGFNYHGARYYIDYMYVWMSPDPLSDEYPSTSPYMYCSGNPVMRIDPNGMSDGWVEGDGTGVYWDKSVNTASEAEAKGLKYHGQTVFAKGESSNRLRYGDSHGGWHDASTLSGVTIHGFKGGGAFCRGMENSMNKGYDPQWIKDFNQFVEIGLNAIDISLTLAMFAEALFLSPSSSISSSSAVAKTSTQGYKSFSAFKRAMGPAGEGQAWHHIVEQNPANIAKFGPEALHNTGNVIKLPNGAGSIHAKVTGYYNSLMPGTNMRVREYVNTLNYQQQYKYGLNVLKRFGY